MKKNKEELSRIHKAKCKELKEIRAKIAADLGLELRQRECTYEGYCCGTCPACRQEEIRLNAALLKKQMEEVNLKSRVAAAGLTAVASLCLTGCQSTGQNVTEGAMENLNDTLDGYFISDTLEEDTAASDETTTGSNISTLPEEDSLTPESRPEDIVLPGEVLEGDVAYLPESGNPEYDAEIPDMQDE